ncbi:MAG: hypothetical protein NVS1B12_15020 [Acidimicrobiales bacterium]
MLATAPRSETRSAATQALRAACFVQALALLVALLILASVDHVLSEGLGCLGLGAAASAVAWRLKRA